MCLHEVALLSDAHQCFGAVFETPLSGTLSVLLPSGPITDG